MKSLPTSACEKGMTFTLADFLEAGAERLGLKLVVGGKAIDRVVDEPIVNRPGLALTGFFEHFAWKRLQLIGNSERAYLDSLDGATRLGRLEALFDHQVYCLIYTNGHKPRRDEIRLAEKRGVALMASSMKTRHFVHNSSFVLAKLGAPRATLYATMIEVAGLGVLIEGDPGLGKSETALGLVKRGAALIADDLTCVRKDVASNNLYCSASESTAGFMEIRGIGIIHIPSIFGVNSVRAEKRLQLVISFKRLADVRGEIDRIGQRRRFRTILGVEVPNIIIPVSEGRDLVNLVETAAQHEKLILSGHDPVEELSRRLRKRADGIEADLPAGKRGK